MRDSSSVRRMLGVLLFVLAAAVAPLYAQAPPPTSDKSEAELIAGVEAARSAHGEESEEHIVALRTLAEFYWSAGRLDVHNRTLERAVALAENVWPDSFALSRLLQNLASAYTSNSEPARARPLLQRALGIRERLLGPDHVDVAVVLLNLGDNYRTTGDFAAALPLLQRGLAIREKGLPPDHPDIGWAHAFLGRLYSDAGDYAQALHHHERALEVREKALGPTHRFVSRSLTEVASVQSEMGNYAAARMLLERALAIEEANLGPQHPNLLPTLMWLGRVLADMGEYAQALALSERAQALAAAVYGPRHFFVAHVLGDLTILYRDLGDLPRAAELYQRALDIYESQPAPPRNNIAISLHNLGVVRVDQGEYEQARQLLERSLALGEEVFGREHPRVATTLVRLALVNRTLGRLDIAVAQIERAVALEEKNGGASHPRLARALNAAAAIHQSAGNSAAAQLEYRRALAIAARGDQPDTLWRIQRGFAVLAAAAGETELAIHWGKSAVNTIQSMRGRITQLSPDLQRAFIADKREVYITLADQLISVGRLAEAQEILAMLKEEELYDFIARASGGDARTTRATFVGQAENAAQRRWSEISGQLVTLGREATELARKARLGTLRTEEQARRAQVDADLAGANQRFDQFVAELSREFAAADARRAEEPAKRPLRNLAALHDELAELSRETVLLQYVVAERRVAIIVTTADVQIARESRIAAAELNRKILEFRRALTERRDVRPAAEELYRILIEPVAADLRQANARTLMLSLDGALRYLPFAALHDGARYLVESYGLSLYTEAARVHLLRSSLRKWTMTGLGVTRAVPGFAPLPGVREELEGIRRSALGGDVFLDEQFTADRLRDRLGPAATPVMHIATHFQFRPGTFANSFLLLGDGSRLTLQEIRDRQFVFSRVELLTLSACDTAMGGGRDETGAEVEGFGALAQRQGAGAVLATLWPVADASTGRFMQILYAGRGSDASLSKAEALRRAQLAFVHGTRVAGIRPDASLAHPFYWAAYVLMGNWL